MHVLKDSNRFLPEEFPLGSWEDFKPRDRAVLMFVQDGNSVLLIHKKRGLGAGKVNAPGGRLEPGESYVDAAIRECQEEVHITPIEPIKIGELYFRFTNGHTIYGEVFWSISHLGTMKETEEALPFWCELHELPYDKMWADDRIWLPAVVMGHKFRGFFDFNEDTMLSGRVEFLQRIES
ncbi:MAG: 8-oxo-dGTP diphosphatase [Spirochaetales bacterium]|nr:8-oxo-dGTP diphosphatase [Spirochaetales bacterium]